jgi:hypothetical protein
LYEIQKTTLLILGNKPFALTSHRPHEKCEGCENRNQDPVLLPKLHYSNCNIKYGSGQILGLEGKRGVRRIRLLLFSLPVPQALRFFNKRAFQKVSNVELHHLVDGSPGHHIPLATLRKQDLGIGVLQGGCGIRNDHGNLLTIVVHQLVVILGLRGLHVGQATQIAGGPRQVDQLLQFGALDLAGNQDELATEVAQGLRSQITTLLGVLGGQHLLAQCILQDLRGGIQGYGLVSMEHQGKNERIVGQRSLRRIKGGVGNGHTAGLQRQIVVGVILPQILVLQADHGLILFIRLDIQLDQTSPRFDHQRQNAVRDVVRHGIGREHTLCRGSHLVVAQLQVLACNRCGFHDIAVD